ncbi:MAG: hypothetical protein HY868_01490 [Chloroflexi bacterium]|nr:hypothetical protein [Chloroflexota bacterium]
MKNKVLLGSLVVLALGLLLGVSAWGVAAQTPTPNDQPWLAVYTYGEPRRIEANSAQWFIFDYKGDRTPITVMLSEGRILGLEFRVYTLDQVLHLDQEDKSVGRGTPPKVACDVDGSCQSAHLQWQGGFALNGPYFVKVTNPNDRWLTIRLYISGEGVTLGPQIPPTPTPTLPAPTAIPLIVPATPVTPIVPFTTTVPLTTTTPTTTTTVVAPPAPVVVAPVPTVPPPPKNDSPYFALMVPDNKEQTISANGRLWYRFYYGGDRSNVLIVLPVGRAIGVNFRVYTQEQASKYTDEKFVGQGNTGKIACDTGTCTSDDYAWQGAFFSSGMYYIEVVNNLDKERTFKLIIRGTNINIEE